MVHDLIARVELDGLSKGLITRWSLYFEALLTTTLSSSILMELKSKALDLTLNILNDLGPYSDQKQF